YGAGNFVVDPEKWETQPNTLWSVGIEIDPVTRPIQYRRMTFEIRQQQDDSLLVEESSAPERLQHEEYLDAVTGPLNNRPLLEALWQHAALGTYERYYRGYLQFEQSAPHVFRPHRFFSSAVHSARRFTKALSGKRKLSLPTDDQHLLWYHLFACHSHREAIATALGILGGELEDLTSIESQRLADRFLPDCIRKQAA
ncbi:MAG: hypothetical protein IH899_19950, partial [Planctomycetes bacterium]|nr:hypothetical protein [Planctomycetota bacterium]